MMLSKLINPTWEESIDNEIASSEATPSRLRNKREIYRKLSGKKVKSCPPPVNNYKITDHFKPKANNSNRPNEPGDVVVRKEER